MAFNMERLMVPPLESEGQDVSKCAAILRSLSDTFEALSDLRRIVSSGDCSLSVTLLGRCVGVLMQYTEQSIWSTSAHVELTHELIGLLGRSRWTEVSEVFSIADEESELYGVSELAFRVLVERVRAHCWKLNPAACAACSRILLATSGRKLGHMLGYFLPLALLHLEDWEPQSKQAGMRMLTHVLRDVTSSELAWSGRGDVMYHTLSRLLHSNHPTTLREVYPCLALLLSKSGRDACVEELVCDWTRLDEVMTVTVQNMRCEDVLAMREVFVSAVLALVRMMRLAVLKHLTALIPVLCEYLHSHQYSSEKSTILTIECLQELSSIAPDRLSLELEPIVKALLKVLLQSNNEELQKSSKQLLRRLSSSSEEISRSLSEAAASSARDLPQRSKLLLRDCVEQTG